MTTNTKKEPTTVSTYIGEKMRPIQLSEAAFDELLFAMGATSREDEDIVELKIFGKTAKHILVIEKKETK